MTAEPLPPPTTTPDTWLERRLADGAVDTRLVVRDGRAAGFSRRNIHAARKRLGIIPFSRPDENPEVRYWELP